MSLEFWIATAVMAVLALVGHRYRLHVHYYWQRMLGSNWFDLIVPWAAPITPEDNRRLASRLNDSLSATKERIRHADLRTLKTFEEQLVVLMNVESERRSSVDSRLSAIVGLASIAATVATGIIVAEAAGTLRFGNAAVRWLVSAAALYLITQLCVAIYWAVRGQERQGYQIDRVEDLLGLPLISVPKVPVRRPQCSRYISGYSIATH